MLVSLKLSDEEFGTEEDRSPIERVEDLLNEQLPEQGVGEFDGNEVGGGYYTLYLYGPNADRLFDVALPIIQGGLTIRPGSYVVKRYGEPGSQEQRVAL